MSAPRHPYRLGGWMLAVFVSGAIAIADGDLGRLRISMTTYMVDDRFEASVPSFAFAPVTVDDDKREPVVICPGVADASDIPDPDPDPDLDPEVPDRRPWSFEAELRQYIALTEPDMVFDVPLGDRYAARSGHDLLHHRAQTVGVDIGVPAVIGELDMKIIRRYVRRQKSHIAHCYEKELLAKPGLHGSVMMQFMIAPDGGVQRLNAAGMDRDVATCVAAVLHGITFPRPRDGDWVEVGYPFHFHRNDAVELVTAAR